MAHRLKNGMPCTLEGVASFSNLKVAACKARRGKSRRPDVDAMDHWIADEQGCGAYLRYTDDFLLFGDDKARLWELRSGIIEQLAGLRLKLAEPKSRLLATKEGVPFCGFCFRSGLAPRVLGATKRRFEAKRYRLHREIRPISQSSFSHGINLAERPTAKGCAGPTSGGRWIPG